MHEIKTKEIDLADDLKVDDNEEIEELSNLNLHVFLLKEIKTIPQFYVNKNSNKNKHDDSHEGSFEDNEVSNLGEIQEHNQQDILEEHHKGGSQNHIHFANDEFDNQYEKYVQECEKTTDLGINQDHYFLINNKHVFFSN